MSKTETQIREEAMLDAAKAIEAAASEGAFKELSGDGAAKAVVAALRIIGAGDWRENS